MIITTDNLNQARREIQTLKKENKQIIVKAREGEFNRKILEIKDVNVLLSLEIHNRKDKLKERDSGLNEILCTIAKKNNIKIGIDVDAIKKIPKKEKARVIARLKQNIFLCKKIGTQLCFFPSSHYSRQDLQALIITLSGSTQQAKNAIK